MIDDLSRSKKCKIISFHGIYRRVEGPQKYIYFSWIIVILFLTMGFSCNLRAYLVKVNFQDPIGKNYYCNIIFRFFFLLEFNFLNISKLGLSQISGRAEVSCPMSGIRQEKAILSGMTGRIIWLDIRYPAKKIDPA